MAELFGTGSINCQVKFGVQNTNFLSTIWKVNMHS